MPTRLSAPAYRLLMTADTVGGVWRYCLDSARALSQAGVTVAVATLGPRASADQRKEASGIDGLELIETDAPLDWICERRDEVTQAATAVAALARNFGADLVQLNGAALAGEAQFAAPVVAAHHSCLATWWANVKGGPLPTDWLWRRELMRDHLLSACSACAPTQAFAEETSASYGLPETPRVIFNGRPQPEAAESRPPIAAVFTAGRLWDEGKNVETINRAAGRIEAPVYAAGSLVGPHGARVSFSHIRSLGVLSESAIRLRLADRPVFVSTPLYEPFGLAVLEAAQAGCALVLSEIATLRELWDGAADFVPARNYGAVAEAVTRLLRDPERREALGAAARERSRRYSLDRSGEALLAWHREILARSRTGGAWESAA